MSYKPKMPDMRVYLVEYDYDWPALFTDERDRIVGALGADSIAVEHIGSTAIPGMAAKPIIDIMVMVDDIETGSIYFEPLKTLDYHYYPYGEDIFPERRWFCKPDPIERTHHLHLVERNTPFHRDHLLFRDYLRTNADAARRYESLKRCLAERYPDDRDGYSDGKSDFVASILSTVRAKAAG